MRGGTPLRRAVAASVGLHVLLAAVLVVVGRWQANRPVAPAPRPGLDTRAALRLEFPTAEMNVPVELPPATRPNPDPPRGSHPPLATDPPAVPEPEDSRPPLVQSPPVPRTLPPELLALLRKPSPTPAAVEASVAPSTPEPVQPAGGSAAAPQPDRASRDGGSPLHGELSAGQTIVYVLDASGSMGEWGKFDVARRALIATLARQAETVRFQVVVYAGTAYAPFRVSGGGCVTATASNVTAVADALRAIGAPAGRSNHAAGLRTALDLRPDFVLILTDANDLPAATVRAVMRQAVKPAVVCMSKVGAEGVGPTVEVK